jgi:hypothetical protein
MFESYYYYYYYYILTFMLLLYLLLCFTPDIATLCFSLLLVLIFSFKGIYIFLNELLKWIY